MKNGGTDSITQKVLSHPTFLFILLSFSLPLLGDWKKLEPGLDFSQFQTPIESPYGNSTLSVLRIDPTQLKLTYLLAIELDSQSYTLPEWTSRFSLLSAINAGMYAKDLFTPVGYSKHLGKVHQRKRPKTYKCFFAFDPKNESDPQAYLGDLQCNSFKDINQRYRTIIQGIRMISCKGNNVWSRQRERWSTSAIGIDSAGSILFLHMQAPISVRNFVKNLQQLPLELSRAMYLEGGSPAGLAIQSKDLEISFQGMTQLEGSFLPSPSITNSKCFGGNASQAQSDVAQLKLTQKLVQRFNGKSWPFRFVPRVLKTPKPLQHPYC